MSDSSIALKPVIDEPSKPIPSSSAASISLGVTAKLFKCPSMSVNQSRRNSMPSSRIRLRTFFRASGSLVALGSLSTCATLVPPFKTQKPRTLWAPEASSPTNCDRLTPSRQTVTAAGVEGLAGQPTRLLGAEEEDDIGHVLRLAEPSEGHLREDPLLQLRRDPPRLG